MNNLFELAMTADFSDRRKSLDVVVLSKRTLSEIQNGFVCCNGAAGSRTIALLNFNFIAIFRPVFRFISRKICHLGRNPNDMTRPPSQCFTHNGGLSESAVRLEVNIEILP